MKKSKVLSVVLALCVIALTFAGCGKSGDDKYLVENPSVVKEQLGIDIVLPEDVKNEKYYVIDDIAKVVYTTDNTYELRIQKVADVDVSDIAEGEKTLKDTFDLTVAGEADSISFYSVKAGGLLAEWSVGECSYSLYCQKAGSDEVAYLTFADTANTVASTCVQAELQNYTAPVDDNDDEWE